VALGWGQAEYLASGNVWVVRRHEIDYLAQVTVGQQLVGETWVDPWKMASCVRRTELVRDGVVVARAATTWAFMSIASGRPQRIPDEMRALFS
jgi:acyl-CoA thioester hydrolase